MTRLRFSAVDIVDVFVYFVVIGTFAQLFPAVISESFLTALVTAVILKFVLEVLVWAKAIIFARMKATKSSRARVVTGASFVLVAAGGKACILWITDVVLGDAVHLGGFLSVTLLVVTLMLARAGVRLLLKN